MSAPGFSTPSNGRQFTVTVTQPSVHLYGNVPFTIDQARVGLELEVLTQYRRILERSAIEGGGTAGVYPNLLDKGQAFDAAAGEILEFRVREVANIATNKANLAISVEAY